MAKVDQFPEQGTKEWHKARRGRVTGSRLGSLMGMPSAFNTRAETIATMITEIRENRSVSIPDNAPMKYGRDHEPIALAAYEEFSFATVDRASIYAHPDEPRFAASPDGLIGTDGGLEIKCPYKYRHGAPDRWLTAEEQPHYYAQIQWCMYCTGRKWWDFFQWAPKGKPALERVKRDDAFIERAIAESYRALSEIDMEIAGTSEADPLQEYDQAIADIAAAKEVLKEAEGRAAGALEVLVGRHGDGHELPDGRRIEKRVTKGSVSYAKAVKALAPGADLSEWTGEPKESWVIVPAK